MVFDTVASLLKEKGKADPIYVAPQAWVSEAVGKMNSANIGAVLVMDGPQLVGIFTERDVLVRVVGGGREPGTTKVSEVMTAAVRTVELATPLEEALRLMSEKRHRHLPVRDGGRVHGMVSMGDVTRWVIRSQQEQVNGAIGAVKRMGMANRRS